MIEDWIDTLCDVWATVDAPGFGTVTSPRLIQDRKFPASISPSSESPIALSFPAVMETIYSLGGPKIGFFTGVTEFHVWNNASMEQAPGLLPWYGAIWRAAALNMTLGGRVEHFVINKSRGIVGPMTMQYGDETPHWGFTVNWEVKEKPAAITVAM